MKPDDIAILITGADYRSRWFTIVDGLMRVEHEALDTNEFVNKKYINTMSRVNISVGLKLIYEHFGIDCEFVYLAKAEKDICEFIESQYPEYIMLYKGIEGNYYITVPNFLPKEAKTMIDLTCATI